MYKVYMVHCIIYCVLLSNFQNLVLMLGYTYLVVKKSSVAQALKFFINVKFKNWVNLSKN